MAEPKFRYNERVEIISGFFTGLTGKVKDVKYHWFGKATYTLDETSAWKACTGVPESYLKSLDRQHEEFNKKLQEIIK